MPCIVFYNLFVVIDKDSLLCDSFFSEVPDTWVKEQLISIGLEVYTQEYKFTYPMNLLNNQTAQGTNVYGILRAPRTPSVESVVMTTPLRPSSSGLTPTDGSVALILSLAEHMKSMCINCLTQHQNAYVLSTVPDISTYKRLTAVWRYCLFGPDEFSSKQVWLLLVDCWIECCNSDHLVKYLGS